MTWPLITHQHQRSLEERLWWNIKGSDWPNISLSNTQLCSSARHTISVSVFVQNMETITQYVCIPLLSIRINSCVSSVSLVEDSLQGLLEFLTSSRCSPTQHLEQEQALARQFAEILHFTLRFDELKVTRQPLVTPTLHVSSLILLGIISILQNHNN